MSRIKICAAEEQIRKNVSGAQDEFIRHCRIRNLSLRTIDYYQEDIEYFLKWSNLKFVDDITKDVMDNFVAHEMDKGNKVTAINSRIRGLRVFFRFCVDKEYMDGFKYPLLKVDQEQKAGFVAGAVYHLMECGAVVFGSVVELSQQRQRDGIARRTVEGPVPFPMLQLDAAALNVSGDDGFCGLIYGSAFRQLLQMLCTQPFTLINVEDVVITQERKIRRCSG